MGPKIAKIKKEEGLISKRQLNEKLDLLNCIRFEVIGKGGFGTVEKWFDLKTQKFMALKHQDVDLDFFGEDYLWEAKVFDFLSKLDPIKFAAFYGYSDNFNEKTKETRIVKLTIAEELGLASLFDLLKARMYYNEPEIFYILEKLVYCLKLAEKYGLSHGDLKIEDIIYTGNTYKLIDFGYSTQLIGENKFLNGNDFKGLSKSSAAPELINLQARIEAETDYNKLAQMIYDPFKADTYSLGIISLKMMGCSFKDIEALNSKKALFELYAQKYPNLMPLIQNLIDEDPAKRFSYEKIYGIIKEQKLSMPTEELHLKKIVEKKQKLLTNEEIQQYIRFYTQRFDNEKVQFYLNLANNLGTEQNEKKD